MAVRWLILWKPGPNCLERGEGVAEEAVGVEPEARYVLLLSRALISRVVVSLSGVAVEWRCQQ